MNETVRQKLIEIARKGRSITYQDLCDECNLGLVMRNSEYERAEIGRILGAISSFEHHHKRPLISSLVLSKGDSYQGDGFYKLCEELGFGPWKKLKNDVTFDALQMNACYAFWKDDNNYEKFK